MFSTTHLVFILSTLLVGAAPAPYLPIAHHAAVALQMPGLPPPAREAQPERR